MKCFVLLSITMLLGCFLYSQERGQKCSKQGISELWVQANNYAAEGASKKCIKILKEIRECSKELDDDYSYAGTFVYISHFELFLDNFDEGIKNLEILDDEIQTLDIEQDSLYGIMADMYYMFGILYYEKGWFEQALKYYQLAINVFLEQLGNTSGDVINYVELGHNFSFVKATVFNNAAMTYYRFGDYDKAIEYFNIAKELFALKKEKINNVWDRAVTIQNQGMCYVETKELKKATDNFNQAIKLMDETPEEHIDETLALIYKNIALFYNASGQEDSTIYYLNKALEKDTKLAYEIIVHQTASNIFLDRKNYQKSISNINEANYLIDSLYGFFHPEMAHNYKLRSQILLEQGHHHSADSLLNIGLNILKKEKASKCDCTNINLHDFFDMRTVFKLLKEKAKILSYLNDSNSIHCYDKLSEVLFELESKYIISEESKYSLTNNAKEVYENAIEFSFNTSEKQKAYEFSQKSRSMILLGQVQEKTAIKASGIPLDMLKELQKMKLEINNFQKLREEAINKKDEKSLSEIEDLLFAKNRSYEQGVKNLEKEHPTYYKLKYKQPWIPIPSIQQTLKSQHSTLIEYFLGEEHLYIFVIDGTDIHIDKVQTDQQLFKDISTLNECISTADYSYATFRKFNESGHRLYNILLKNAIDKGWIDNRNLIIIPDEQLNLIPFEALVTKQQEFNDTFPHYHQLDYLVMDYDISYHYSSNLIQGKSKGKDGVRKSFLGIAPTFTGRNIQKLENNISEIQNAASHYPDSEILQSDNANYQNILSSIKGYKTVHFATHAIFNDEIPLDSRIELADTSLYIYEIFGMEHNLDLAIMSACETASGKRRKGEGVISLSRAFIQSGCPSVIASLWSISDQKTSMLMKNFYEYFNKGKTAKASLSEAKRKYISEAMSKNVHPFYWAGFIQVGTADTGNEGIPLYYWMLGGIILLLALFTLWKVRK